MENDTQRGETFEGEASLLKYSPSVCTKRHIDAKSSFSRTAYDSLGRKKKNCACKSDLNNSNRFSRIVSAEVGQTKPSCVTPCQNCLTVRVPAMLRRCAVDESCIDAAVAPRPRRCSGAVK